MWAFPSLYPLALCVRNIPLTLHNITLFSVYAEDPVGERKYDTFHIIRIDLDLGATDEQRVVQSV